MRAADDWNNVPDSSGSDKLTPGELTKSSREIRWLDNFWYYHKWKVIIAAFFLVVLVIGLVQIFSRVEYDVYVTVAVPYTMNAEENGRFTELLQKFCPRDFNGDGDLLVYVQGYQVYSDSEYESEKAYWEVRSEQFQINSVYNQSQIRAFDQYLMNGQSTLLLLSPYMFETKKDNGHLLALVDVYGEDPLPEGVTADGYGCPKRTSTAITLRRACCLRTRCCACIRLCSRCVTEKSRTIPLRAKCSVPSPTIG